MNEIDPALTDLPRRKRILEAEKFQDHCISLLSELCKESWSFDDEMQMREDAMNLICTG